MRLPDTDVARHLPGLIEGHVEPGAFRVLEGETFTAAVTGNQLQAFKSPDAMIQMNDIVARLKFSKVDGCTSRHQPLASLGAATLSQRGRAAKQLCVGKHG